MADKTETKKGTPTRDFTDAGTGESFTKGEAASFEAGAHANYLAAGLITDGPAKAPAAADKPAT